MANKKNGLDLGSESWHGTVNVTAPPPVAATDGESALGAALGAAGQQKRRGMHREYGL